MPNVEVHIFPGILHGYTMPSAKAFDAKTRAFSMGRARAILEGLRDAPAARIEAAE
jgi:carboxymethylenebutenolidase